jgi:hypothetical protein
MSKPRRQHQGVVRQQVRFGEAVPQRLQRGVRRRVVLAVAVRHGRVPQVFGHGEPLLPPYTLTLAAVRPATSSTLTIPAASASAPRLPDRGSSLANYIGVVDADYLGALQRLLDRLAQDAPRDQVTAAKGTHPVDHDNVHVAFQGPVL